MQPGDPGGHLRGRAVAATAVPFHLLFLGPASLPPPPFSPPLQPPHLLLHSLPAPTPPSLLPLSSCPTFRPTSLTPTPNFNPWLYQPCILASPLPLCFPSSLGLCALLVAVFSHFPSCCSSRRILRPCYLPCVPLVFDPASHPFCPRPLPCPTSLPHRTLYFAVLPGTLTRIAAAPCSPRCLCLWTSTLILSFSPCAQTLALSTSPLPYLLLLLPLLLLQDAELSTAALLPAAVSAARCTCPPALPPV